MPQKQELNPPLQRPNRPQAPQPRLYRHRSSPLKSAALQGLSPRATAIGNAKDAALTSEFLHPALISRQEHNAAPATEHT